MAGARHRFAADSVAASRVEPGALLESSLASGWRSALLRVYRGEGESEKFETPPTADLKIVVNLAGQSELRYFRDGLWRIGVKDEGAIGLTPPGETSRLRWRSLGGGGFCQAHLHLPGALLEEAREERRRQGMPIAATPIHVAAADDAIVAAIVGDLVQGLRAGADDLFAEERVRLLAARLTAADVQSADWRAADRPSPMPSEARLLRATAFMSADLSIEHGVDEIAREAGISVFHFTRMFRQATGRPPHAFLTDLRLRAACDLLERSDAPIAEVARLVGYPIARNFNAAFARRYGCAPGVWRRDRRGTA